MTRPAPELPEQPLERFLSIYRALEEDRRWTEGALPLQFAAASLVTTPGSPQRVAAGLRTGADELRERAGWFSPLRSSIRFLIAAVLLRDGLDATTFDGACADIVDELKARKLGRGRTTHGVLAALILVNNDDGRMHPERLDRMAAIFHAMKEHHPWLTNTGDYAPCALLATTDTPVDEMMRRIEAAYDGLRQRGYGKNDQVQRASHLMFFNPAKDTAAVDRFDALFQRFKQEGLWMHGGDYDEMAILSFVDAGPSAVVDLVLRHRERIRELRPRPGKEVSFSLACGTAFLELVRGAGPEILGTQHLLQLQAILDAQAASVAASSAASAAAASG